MNIYPFLRPVLNAIDAERAHRLAIWALKQAPLGKPPASEPSLATRVFGLDFANPIGLAAGFDKHAEVPYAAASLGFGFVELGSVTPRPQPGNPRPRVFRLDADRAVINRYGFNSVGIDRFLANLAVARQRSPGMAGRIRIGINIGKNRDTPAERAAQDYARAATAAGAAADYFVVNVSSPNTPGLRALQGREELLAIAAAVRAGLGGGGASGSAAGPALLLKIAPDLGERDLADIATVALAGHFDGIIVANTTIQRPPSLRGRHCGETGGLSGAPLRPLALAALRAMRRLTEGRLPLIGVGGIASGADAYAFIRAGASLVEFYTALVFHGPGLVARIKRDLAALLRRDRFATVADAVGTEGP